MDVYEEVSLDSVLEYWSAVRHTIRECLKITPDRLLSWAPRQGMQTFGLLYVHIANSVDWWLTTVFEDGGVWAPTANLPKDDKSKLDDHLARSFDRMMKFAMTGDFAQSYIYKGEERRGAWIVIHMLRHYIHHCAQIMVYLRQNGIEPPSSD